MRCNVSGPNGYEAVRHVVTSKPCDSVRLRARPTGSPTVRYVTFGEASHTDGEAGNILAFRVSAAHFFIFSWVGRSAFQSSSDKWFPHDYDHGLHDSLHSPTMSLTIWVGELQSPQLAMERSQGFRRPIWADDVTHGFLIYAACPNGFLFLTGKHSGLA